MLAIVIETIEMNLQVKCASARAFEYIPPPLVFVHRILISMLVTVVFVCGVLVHSRARIQPYKRYIHFFFGVKISKLIVIFILTFHFNLLVWHILALSTCWSVNL